MRSEILEEVWRARDEFARRHNYDLDAMVTALRQMERRPGAVVVDRAQLHRNEDHKDSNDERDRPSRKIS